MSCGVGGGEQKAERKLERVLSEEEDEERLGGCVCWDSSVQCGADAHRIQVHAYSKPTTTPALAHASVTNVLPFCLMV